MDTRYTCTTTTWSTDVIDTTAWFSGQPYRIDWSEFVWPDPAQVKRDASRTAHARLCGYGNHRRPTMPTGRHGFHQMARLPGYRRVRIR